MKRTILLIASILTYASCVVWADTFGEGANQFEIDFVTISGDASSANGTNIGLYKPEGFADPSYSYRMGTYEITNGQWTKFLDSYGSVNGSPSNAYNDNPQWAAPYAPCHNVSWLEAAQFVNWLNTSNGHAPAYKFTGTKGQSDYTFTIWDITDAGYDASNPFRNSNSYYFLPTENEWVKAAYWNGSNLQTYATVGDVIPVKGQDSNYSGAYLESMTFRRIWDVGSGSKELNGTYDMMGNVGEWMESPYLTDYISDSVRGFRGGHWILSVSNLTSVARVGKNVYQEENVAGFRVAAVPEPATLLFLGMGGLLTRKRK